ncbi:MAG: hypothetical protein ACR5LD_06145 [Symbiopectobacterium sp.]
MFTAVLDFLHDALARANGNNVFNTFDTRLIGNTTQRGNTVCQATFHIFCTG